MKKRSPEKQVESNFLSSMLFLVFSLGLSLTVFLSYRPSNSFNADIRKYSVAEEKPKQELPKKSVKASVKHAVAENGLEKSSQDASVRANMPTVAASVAQKNANASGDAHDLVKRAIELVNQSQVGEAKQLLEKILQDNPENEEALTQLALIHLLDYKDEKAAQPFFEKALSVNPNNKTALSELVEIYAERGDGSGVKYLESLYEKSPNSSIALGIGQVLMDTNPKAAIPYLEKAGDHGLNDLSEAYIMNGNHGKAVETLQRQEDILTNTMQSGEPERNSYAKEELVRVKMNIIHSLKAQGKTDQVSQKISELKAFVGNDPDARSYLDSLGMTQPKNKNGI